MNWLLKAFLKTNKEILKISSIKGPLIDTADKLACITYIIGLTFSVNISFLLMRLYDTILIPIIIVPIGMYYFNKLANNVFDHYLESKYNE